MVLEHLKYCKRGEKATKFGWTAYGFVFEGKARIWVFKEEVNGDQQLQVI